MGGSTMENSSDLKQRLIKIRDDNWNVPEGVNSYELALELMDNIGSTDPELRDLLVLELLYKMVVENDLTDRELKNILELALSEKHLFKNLGEQEGESVFNRTFTVLIIGGMLWRHNNNEDKLFTREEIKRIYKYIVKYAREEKDLRGYVKDKGWAHSAAHTADVLGEIALCKEIEKSELLEILAVIKEKVCVNNYAYIDHEDERLVSVVMSIIERRILDNDEIANWIRDFKNINKTGQHQEDQYLVHNQKNFLSALYFRLKRRDEAKEFFETIEEVLNEIIFKPFK